jgi:hypothetical protein
LFNKIKEKKMKKIYVVLLMSLLLGFVAGSKAKGQPGCEVCVPPLPGMCYVLEFSVPNCCDEVRAVFCYECGLTRPWIRVYVQDVTYCPQCDDYVWDYIHNWAVQNMQLLCQGEIPCDEGEITIYYTEPFCAEIIWNGNTGKVTVRSHSDSCDVRCTEEWKICTDYSTTPPTKRQRMVRKYPTGDGHCPRIEYGTPDSEYRFERGISWRLPCALKLPSKGCVPFP